MLCSLVFPNFTKEDSQPLSYLSLKCVWEYVNVYQRAHIARRTPSLRPLQNTVPTHINTLCIIETDIAMDGFTHCITHLKEDHDAGPGDIEKRNELWQRKEEGGVVSEEEEEFLDQDFIRRLRNLETCEYHMTGAKKDRVVKLPEGTDISNAAYQLVGFYLSGIIHVDRLGYDVDAPDGIPEGATLKIRELYTSAEAINVILPVLDGSSFPLQKLSINVGRPDDAVFQNQALFNSESLDLRISQRFGNWSEVLSDLTNKHVHISYCYSFWGIAEEWIRNPREAGRKLSMETDTENLREFLKGILEYAPTVEKVLDTKRTWKFPYCASIQLNAISELNIYGQKIPETPIKRENKWMIVMEVMPIGTAKPVKYAWFRRVVARLLSTRLYETLKK